MKTAVPLVLLLLWVPFVLQTDLYPLFRFGMFAEPVKRDLQTETFALRTVDANGHARLVQAEETGLGSLAYLMRNYHYRRQADTLLRRIHRLRKSGKTEPSPAEWQLLRVTRTQGRPRPDTTVAATYRPAPHE